MWSKPIVLSSNYCKDKRGIVGDDEFASWEYAAVLLILCFYYDVMGYYLSYILHNFASWEYGDVLFILLFLL